MLLIIISQLKESMKGKRRLARFAEEMSIEVKRIPKQPESNMPNQKSNINHGVLGIL